MLVLNHNWWSTLLSHHSSSPYKLPQSCITFHLNMQHVREREREVWMGIGAAVRPPGREPAWDSRCPCASWQASPPICGGAASVQGCQLALRSAQTRFTRGNLQLDQTDLNMLPQGMTVSIYISSIGVMCYN